MLRADHVLEVLLNLLGTLEIGKQKVVSLPVSINPHTSREQVQEKAQVHCGSCGCISLGRL